MERRTPLSRGPGPARRTPMKPRRSAPRVRDRASVLANAAHGTLSWGWVRVVIYDRSGGSCELCSTPLRTIKDMEGHHRRTRRVGPDCPGNALAVCHGCHHAVIHDHPTDSIMAGWIVSQHTHDPCSRPVRVRGLWVVLGCDGTITEHGGA